MITHDRLADVFDMLGLGATDEDVAEMLNEVEPSGSQLLSFDQVRPLILSPPQVCMSVCVCVCVCMCMCVYVCVHVQHVYVVHT